MPVEAGIVIAQLLLKYGPVIAQQVAELFAKPTHELSDWMAIFAKVKTSAEMQADAEARAAAGPIGPAR